jgi:hypothetical protein
MGSASATATPSTDKGKMANDSVARQGRLDAKTLSDGQSVFAFDAQVSNGTVDLGASMGGLDAKSPPRGKLLSV